MGEVGFILFLYLDGKTGLAYNRFRYYSPETGAYINAHQSCRHPEQDRAPKLGGHRDTPKPPQHIADICCGGFGILGLLDLMTFVSTNR